MNSLERVLATLDGKPVDHLAFLPITMQYACDLLGAKYKEYVTDYRVLVKAQLAVVDAFDADLVSVISDPGVNPPTVARPSSCRRMVRRVWTL